MSLENTESVATTQGQMTQSSSATHYIHHTKKTKLHTMEEKGWKYVAVSIDQAGDLYLTGDLKNQIYKFEVGAKKMTLLLGNATQGDQDGEAAVARFHQPLNMVFCSQSGSTVAYITDKNNNCIRQFDVGTNCIITPIKGLKQVRWIALDEKRQLLYSYIHLQLMRTDLSTMETTCIKQFDKKFGSVGEPEFAFLEINRKNPDELFLSDTHNHAIYSLNLETGAIESIYSAQPLEDDEQYEDKFGAIWDEDPFNTYYFDGHLYFVHGIGGRVVKKLNLKTKQVEDIAHLGARATCLVGDPVHNHCIYACTKTEIFIP